MTGFGVTLVFLLAAAAGALAAPPAAMLPSAMAVPNAAVPPGANTSDRARPFYIDLAGLDLKTSPPTRDPHNPAYPAATELPDGALPPANAVGNFILGPTHKPAPETASPQRPHAGRMIAFVMSSAESVIYQPGIARDEHAFDAAVFPGRIRPGDPSALLVDTSQPASWRRTISVYIPAGSRQDGPRPFLVIGDGEFLSAGELPAVMDRLEAARRIPDLVAIFIGSGGQDAQGSERGREYDTVSGTYAQWVESEILPRVERAAGIRLTRDPDGRAMMGGSSAGAASITAAWFRPDLYRRVLAYSPTLVNQQWPHDPALPGGAWEYHSPFAGPAPAGLAVSGFVNLARTGEPTGTPLILNSPRKPIRIWFEVGDRDLFYPVAAMADGMHDWVLASERMAQALAARQYSYQFVFARNAGHVDQAVMAQTLPAALEWLWAGYRTAKF